MTSDPNTSIRARVEGRYEEIAENVGKCVFCDLREKYVIKRTKDGVLTVNLYPYIDGQLVVLPVKHVERLEELTEAEALTMHRLNLEGVSLLKEGMGIENVWLILREGLLRESGKTVAHLHWNIVPYVEGLNTWNYREISLAPIDLATRLRGLDK